VYIYRYIKAVYEATNRVHYIKAVMTTANNNPADITWQDRIIETKYLDVNSLYNNPSNFRVHSKYQKDTLEGVLNTVGIVAPIIVNTSYVVLDGHLRLSLAREKGQKKILASIVNLNENECNIILTTFDAITLLAKEDTQLLIDLTHKVNSDNAAIQTFISDMVSRDLLASEKTSKGGTPSGDSSSSSGETSDSNPDKFVPNNFDTYKDNPGDFVEYGEPKPKGYYGSGDNEDEDSASEDNYADGQGDEEDIDVEEDEGDEALRVKKEKDPNVGDGIKEASSDLGGTFQLKYNMNFIPSSAPYEIPRVRSDRLFSVPLDKELQTWAGDDLRHLVNPDAYQMLLYSASCRSLDFTKSILHFFTQDVRFEPFWTKADQWVSKFLNIKLMAMVGPDYSVYRNMPIAVQVHQIYRIRWLMRYVQESGIPIIPNIPWSFSDTFQGEGSFEALTDLYLAGLPEYCPTIMFQYQTGSDQYQASSALVEESHEYLKEVIRRLNPDTIICYTGKPGKEIMENYGIAKRVKRLIYLDTYRTVRGEHLRTKNVV